MSHFSFTQGVSSPRALIEACGRAGWDHLFLSDVAGTWGAAQAAEAGAENGVSITVGARFTLDDGSSAHFLAPPGQWSALVRAVSHAHACHSPHREKVGVPRARSPVVSLSQVRAFAETGGVVLLGAHSDVVRCAHRDSRHDVEAFLKRWKATIGVRCVVAISADSACSPQSVAAATMIGHAARGMSMRLVHLPEFRYLTPSDRRMAHVLDATRDVTALPVTPAPRIEHVTSSLVSGDMARLLGESIDHDGGERLARHTAAFVEEMSADSRSEQGIGKVYPPEDGMVTATSGGTGDSATELEKRCREALPRLYPGTEPHAVAEKRLDDELRTIRSLGYSAFFLTTATVVDLARKRGIRAVARGSAVGSLVCHALGISPVDPIGSDLLMERFCTTLRTDLPDIDVDVESARRHEVYQATFDHFGTDRVAAVGMIDTMRARSAIRAVGGALGISPGRVDQLAKAAPWHGTADLWRVFHEMPELKARALVSEADRGWLRIAQQITGSPRHASMHPCGLVTTDISLLDRVSVQATGFQWPMCQLDKHDVETMGLLKVDVLGVRMQSSIAHAVEQIRVSEDTIVAIDDIPVDDEDTYRMLRSTETVGVFQVESPGQRALGGKMCPSSMTDLTSQISLFRPGPVKADMISPFVATRQGTANPRMWPDDVQPIVDVTGGVVVWHEQVMEILSRTSGVPLARADMARRMMGKRGGADHVESWWRPAALDRGYTPEQVDAIWEVVVSFASFGFCRAHAAAFARTTYESAWLKTHYPAAFMAGLLEHDPGLYPTRVLVAEARRLGVNIAGPCVSHSKKQWAVEVLPSSKVWRDIVPGATVPGSRVPTAASAPRCSGYAVRAPMRVIDGLSARESESIVGGAPYVSLADVWERAEVSGPHFELLAEVGALDCVVGGSCGAPASEGGES